MGIDEGGVGGTGGRFMAAVAIGRSHFTLRGQESHDL